MSQLNARQISYEFVLFEQNTLITTKTTKVNCLVLHILDEDIYVIRQTAYIKAYLVISAVGRMCQKGTIT